MYPVIREVSRYAIARFDSFRSVEVSETIEVAVGRTITAVEVDNTTRHDRRLLETKGDANNAPDASLVPVANLDGVGITWARSRRIFAPQVPRDRASVRHHALMGEESSGPRNVHDVLSSVTEPWSPRTVAVVNDYDVRVVKVWGEFTRHSHPETDEFFLVMSGSLTIRMDDGDVCLQPGDAYVVPRGWFHQPFAELETTVLLFEPSETVNTGDTPSPLTAERRLV